MTYADDSQLPLITDEMLKEWLGKTLPYTAVILKAGRNFSPSGPNRDPEVAATIWKHGKRNAALRAAGLMPIICPVGDPSEISGVCVMATSLEDADRILSIDPAVKAGILTYEIHATRSFPGSSLPAWIEGFEVMRPRSA